VLAPLFRQQIVAHHGTVLRPRILIAEDSAQMRRLMRTLVEDMAGEIVECGGGEEAVALYHATRPDWVLMDIHMPGLDGLAATREIRRYDGAARIVIVTQFDEQELRRAAADAGAIGYVLKENLLGIRRMINGE
jgi:CheY-like chemotaxis protein